MRFLVSGGPTHEYLDDVRFLGNPSTGSMGITIAQCAVEKGHDATLVLGPTHLEAPPGVSVVSVTSALEMREAMVGSVEGMDAVIMSAAVSDYRPRERVEGKIKKGQDQVSLDLVKNPDILGDLGRMPGTRVVVGYALEAAPAEIARDHARDKLTAKKLDAIVLNRRGSFRGTAMEDVTVLDAGGGVHEFGAPDKASLARWLIAFCEEKGGNGSGGVGEV